MTDPLHPDGPVPQPERDEADDRWERILATSNDAFVGIDEHDVVTDWNPAAEELFGWAAGEAVGRTLAELLIPVEFRARHHAGMERFLREGTGQVMFRPLELPALHRSGKRLPVELRIWPARVQGEWRFYAFLRDLREEQLSQAHVELLGQVADAANGAMQAEEAVRAALTEICAMTGWPAGHAYLVAPDDPAVLEPTGWWHLDGQLPEFVAATENRRFRAGEGLPGRVLEMRRPLWSALHRDEDFPRARHAFADGLHSGFAFPVVTGSAVVAVLEFYTSETVETDQRLLDLVHHVGVQLGRVFERQRAIEEIAAASQMKTRMMSMLAHDVRTPLVTIRNFANLLAEDIGDASPDELRHYADRIAKNALRLERMVSSLLTGARAEAGRLVAHPEHVDVREAVEEVTDDIGLDDPLQLDVDGGLRVYADPGHLRQILSNLLTNADKYGEPPIELRAQEQDGVAAITVTDHGPGLAADTDDELFTPFVRGGTRDRGRGTGLGLWISLQLARHNGGDLRHEPAPDLGARLVLTIPVAPGPERSDAATGGSVLAP